jgi:hypothetical protein
VQPYDEDEQFFLPSFTITGASVEWNWQGKTDNSEKNLSSATLSTTNPTWTDPGLRIGRPATNRLSHGTAI